MKTLIELYDQRPLENVLSAEMFRPERLVYICSEQIAGSKKVKEKLRGFFKHRGIDVEIEFMCAQRYDTQQLLSRLKEVVKKYDDCVLDITGGSEAALFAAGLACAELNIPVFTYSRKRNCFYDILNAPFGRELPCTVEYDVEDCFLMAGGSMRTGRVDNAILDRYMDDIDPFFQLYLAHRRNWNKIVTYIQRVSQSPKGEPVNLRVRGDYRVKGERGSRIDAPEAALRGMQDIGFISELEIEPGRSVSFSFRDSQIRSWLRDVGSVLELYVYKACVDVGLFNDVRTSVIVDWEGENAQDAVTNELDVMASRAVTPVFISCKTCDVNTEALNELAILRDRFGGQIARAAIVTAERGGSAMRNRAEELDIVVIDLNDLSRGNIHRRLRNMMR